VTPVALRLLKSFCRKIKLKEKRIQKRKMHQQTVGEFPFGSLRGVPKLNTFVSFFDFPKIRADIDELSAALEAEEIIGGYTESPHTLCRCCHFFRESGRFNLIPSYCKIGTFLNLDAKAVWTQWDWFQRSGLEDGQAGRPPCLSSDHLDTFVACPFAQCVAVYYPLMRRRMVPMDLLKSRTKSLVPLLFVSGFNLSRLGTGPLGRVCTSRMP
jgi:hypothetical protein